MRYTGIYQITNLTNAKRYIGQSRDVYTRWKAHTQALSDQSNESVIRMAFAKYGLRQQVSQAGIFGSFKFEILEQCDDDELLAREADYIKRLQPEYNVQGMGGVHPMFSKRAAHHSQYFVQYHSYPKMGYIPGEPAEGEDIETNRLNHGVFTRKRLAVNLLGAHVVLIFGCKTNYSQHMRYFLWSEMRVEDIQYQADDQIYLLQGIEHLMQQPIDVTDLDGFSAFRQSCGNFAYGLQAIEEKPFFRQHIASQLCQHRLQTVMSYNDWIDDFIERVTGVTSV